MKMPMIQSAVLALTCAVVLVACSGDANDEAVGSQSSLVTGATSWKLPTDVRAAGAEVRVAYEGPPKWTGKCPYSSLSIGAKDLGVFLRDKFADVSSVGGYSCRPNTANKSETSVHGTGRALDVFIPMHGGAADSTKGDPVANWIVMNATTIGVQLIIWNHSIWRANGTNEGKYGGPIPHIDHIHVEITNAASKKLTPWFANQSSTDPTTPDPSTQDPTTDEDAGDPSNGDPQDPPPPPPEDDDAGVPTDPEPPADPGTPDASSPIEAGAPSHSQEQPGSPGATPTSSSAQNGEGDDGPGERDSLGTRSSRSSANRNTMASSGCGVTRVASSGENAALFVAAALACAGLRRRKRSINDGAN